MSTRKSGLQNTASSKPSPTRHQHVHKRSRSQGSTMAVPPRDQSQICRICGSNALQEADTYHPSPNGCSDRCPCRRLEVSSAPHRPFTHLCNSALIPEEVHTYQPAYGVLGCVEGCMETQPEMSTVHYRSCSSGTMMTVDLFSRKYLILRFRCCFVFSAPIFAHSEESTINAFVTRIK